MTLKEKTLYPKKYDVKKGSATWRHKMKKAYKESEMELPEKFKARSKALKKMKGKC